MSAVSGHLVSLSPGTKNDVKVPQLGAREAHNERGETLSYLGFAVMAAIDKRTYLTAFFFLCLAEEYMLFFLPSPRCCALCFPATME